jgi:hypothetical protein
MVMKVLDKVNNLYGVLQSKKTNYLNHNFDKFIVNYELNGDKIKVYSNVGKYRMIKNTHSNIVKLNRVIVHNKIDISNKIDEYESTNSQRLIVLIFNILIDTLCGLATLSTFFVGSYILFSLSVITFGLCVITTSMSGLNYYILAKEIQNLKYLTGYKKENEINLPKFKTIKSR